MAALASSSGPAATTRGTRSKGRLCRSVGAPLVSPEPQHWEGACDEGPESPGDGTHEAGRADCKWRRKAHPAQPPEKAPHLLSQRPLTADQSRATEATVAVTTTIPAGTASHSQARGNDRCCP